MFPACCRVQAPRGEAKMAGDPEAGQSQCWRPAHSGDNSLRLGPAGQGDQVHWGHRGGAGGAAAPGGRRQATLWKLQVRHQQPG